jgi:hypothetical protein
MAETENDPLIGQLLDRRYRVVRKLGGGGMGTVYEVEHSLLRAPRALKLIKGELAQEPGYRQRFFNEARWLNEAHHPHIVSVHDFQEDPDHGLFIVMELIRGENLKALIQERGRLPYTEVLRIGREVAMALDHVHRLGRVHRDVKPANILVEEDTGRAVVTDFGIAKDLSGTGDETLTGTLEVVGTLNYASPEQLGGDKEFIDRRTDIYALGAVLFEMYSGKHYGGIGSVSRLKYPEPPPEEFRLAVRACLELDIDRRLPTAAELIEKLTACEQLAVPGDTAGAPVPRAPEPLAARGAEDRPIADPDAPTLVDAETARATAARTQVGGTAPPQVPKDGTATIQQRQAHELREQVLRAQIEEQHHLIGELRTRCVALQQNLSRFGLSASGFTALEGLQDELARVAAEPDLEQQRASLERVTEELGQAGEGIASALVQAADEAARELLAGVAHLGDLGAPFVDTEGLRMLAEGIEAARDAFTKRDFARGRAELDEGERRLGEAREAAVATARRAVEQQLDRAADAAARITALSAPGVEPVSVDEARTEAAGLIEAGRLPEACDLAERAAAALADDLAALESAAAAARERRAAVEAVRRALDADAAEAAAGAIEASEAARRRAEAALAENRFEEASAEYEREAELLRQAGADLDRARAERDATLRRDVESWVERAAEAPPELVGAAVAQAESLLGGDGPSEPNAAIAALVEARDELAAALDARSAFDEATRRRITAAELSAVTDLDPEERRAVEALAGAGEAALERRDWRGAAEAFANVEAECRRIEQERRLRALRRQVAEARAAAESAHGEIDPADAEDLAAARLAAAESLLGRAAEAEHAGDLEQAAELYTDAAAGFAGVRDQVEAALGELLAAAERDLVAAVEQAATAPPALIGPEHTAARDLLGGSGPAAPRPRAAALAEARAALGAALALRAEHEAAFAARAETASALDRTAAAGVPESELNAAREIIAASEPLLAERQWISAAEELRRATAALERAEVDHRRSEEMRRTGEARAAAERARDAVDREYAAEIEAGLLAEASGHAEVAELEENRQQFGAARAAWLEAEESFVSLGRVVAEAKAAARGEAEDALRAQLERTSALPDELAHSARERAEALLGGERPAVFRDEIAALQEAAAALEQVAAARPEYERAAAARAEASSASERLASLKPRRAQRRGVEALLAAAAKAAGAADWTGAADAYAEARGTIEELDRTLREKPPGPSLVKIGAGAAAAVAVAIAAYVAFDFVTAPSEERIAAVKPPVEVPAEPVVAPRPAAEAPGEPIVEGAPPVDEAAEGSIEPPAVAKAPPDAAAPAPRIAGMSPEGVEAGVRAGRALPFSVEVEGGDPDSPPVVRWLLDGEAVGSGAEWKYTPAAGAAGAHEVVASIDGGPRRSWKVEVAANRPPILTAEPAAGAKIEARAGETVRFRARAEDLDGDELAYRWTVDGKPAGGDSPELSWKVKGDHAIAVTVSDADDAVTSDWRIALAKVPPLDLRALPARIERLGFGASQEFSLAAPAGKSLADIDVAWTIDGRKASGGPKLSFAADQPAYVRSSPVRIAAAAKGAEGQTFSHEWRVTVEPPPPRIASAAPAAAEIDGEAGRPIEFGIETAAPVGGQKLTYVFSVDGAEAQKGDRSSYALTPREGGEEIRVTAKVDDNYRQSSQQRSWTVRLGDVTARARQWLSQLQAAFNAQDAARVASLRGLDGGKRDALRRAFETQKQYKVDFSATDVQRVDAGRSRVSYEMSQTWVAPNGQPGSSRSRCTHVLAVDGDRVTDTTADPCTRLP